MRSSKTITLIQAAFFLFFSVSFASAGENPLYSFQTGNDCAPYGSLISDTSGNLYGTTYGDRVHYGNVYELTRGADGTWTETVLYTFSGPDGRNPVEGLTRDAAGNLYGTVPIGGADDRGLVFELSPGSGGWTESTLYTFTGGNDGAIPYSTLYLDASGNLYGTASQGGAAGNGVVFELTHGSNGWTENVLYNFTGGDDGSWPSGPLAFDPAGNIYGTTNQGSVAGLGGVYKLSPSSGGWTETTLHQFTGGDDGALPNAGLTRATNGILYGTATGGGTSQAGVVFQERPSPNALSVAVAPWMETVDYAFSGGDDGANPDTGVVFDQAGNLYGAAEGGSGDYGVVYRMTPSSTGWSQSVLYTFTGGADGGFPESTVMLDSSGNVYGTTVAGGANSCGVAYQVTP